MIFQNKAALWLLLGIPILIIIYLIRSQHQDYPVSSTYIWKLSAKFRKKRLPMQKLRRMLLFLTQLLLIATVAIAIAGPSIPNGDSCNYIIILDCSASMNTVDNEGSSRFDRAVALASEYADKINEGHTVSLITSSDTAAIVLRDSDSATEYKRTLSSVSCTNGTFSLSEAVSLAETVASGSGKANVIVFTDSDYEASAGTSVVNVNSGEWNISIAGVTTSTSASLGTEFTAMLYSEGKTATVTVGLKVDGSIKDVCEVTCNANETTTVTFSERASKNYSSAEVYVIAKDGLDLDNSYSVCNKTVGNVSVLLVSDQPFYLESCFNSFDNCKLTVVSTESETDYKGYNLYVFDSFTPEYLPTDGSILFVNSSASGLVNLGDEVERESVVSKGDVSTFPSKLSSITDNVSDGTIYISTYTPITSGAGWTNVLFCDSDCVMSIKTTDTGLITAVMSFDLHNSNLPMLSDFVYLMKNILNSSLPTILYDNDFVLGESIDFSLLPSASGLYLEDPAGGVVTLSGSGNVISYTPSQLGVYTAVETIGGSGTYADFFVHVSSSESRTPEKGTLNIALSSYTVDEDGNLTNTSGVEVTQALTPLWFYFILAALVLLIIEWEVYYYEQY